ncbi:hypothetical protein E4582_10735 [Luteimonas yindakuii]|uniref:Uncharacterized protein n=1 Tax=Luteimonas yindakuii TaxID=2565782 RepID=A0A4Z1R9U9_9GAMM|nr:hypothetical protein E5843_00470 [Luteimonas yindakuii]TKS55405.1 hypothetical protein E4582_10735 [Luteimonas yindakuii]
MAAPPEPVPARAPLSEISDAELGDMRGRYVVGNDLVAWFGVTMTSVWQTTSGQTLQGALQLGMDFSAGGTPTLSFEPTVSITAADAPLPVAASGATVDAAGLANVSGLVQSVQVAGDHNAVSNVTALRVREGEAPAPSAPQEAATRTASASGMQVSAGVADGMAQVLLQVDGQGLAMQWLRSGSAGQSVQLAASGQQIHNQLQIDLVRQSLPATANLQRDVAQAIGLNRGVGI